MVVYLKGMRGGVWLLAGFLLFDFFGCWGGVCGFAGCGGFGGFGGFMGGEVEGKGGG